MTEQFVPQGLAISQVACVVHDIDEAMERYHAALGWGPWNVYEHVPPSLHDTHYMGKPDRVLDDRRRGRHRLDRLRAAPAAGRPEHLQGLARTSTARASTTSP